MCAGTPKRRVATLPVPAATNGWRAAARAAGPALQDGGTTAAAPSDRLTPASYPCQRGTASPTPVRVATQSLAQLHLSRTHILCPASSFHPSPFSHGVDATVELAFLGAASYN